VLELDPRDSSAAEFLVERFDAQGRPDEIARVLAPKACETTNQSRCDWWSGEAATRAAR